MTTPLPSQHLTPNDNDVPAVEPLEHLDDRRFDMLFEQGELRGESIRTALVTIWQLDRFRLRR